VVCQAEAGASHRRLLEKSVRILVTTLLALILMVAAACSSSNSTPVQNGPLSGNWQFNLQQNEPSPATALSFSGFLQESLESGGNALAGSLEVPTDPTGDCGGVVALTGSVNGQTVTFSVNQNGTVLTFTGTAEYNSNAMSGSYAGPGGSCFEKPTTGTWSATLVPPISGSFTGYLSNSAYMAELGITTPIPVSGTLTQSDSAGGSNASVAGTITATGYPCFSTATLVGTVSGQNLLLAVYSYTGEQIGSLGSSGAPATITSGSTGTSVSGSLTLGGRTASGEFGPCPAIENGTVEDSADACLGISPSAACSISSDVAVKGK
jgi:hypothetical protein